MRPALYTDDMATTPDDAELERLIEYAAGAMSASETKELEDRLSSDPAFFYRVTPVLKVLHSREPLAVEIEIAQQIQALRAANPRVERTWTPKKLVLLATAATAPVKAIAVFGAAATVMVAVALRPRPSEPDHGQVFVQAPRPAPNHPSTTVAVKAPPTPRKHMTVAAGPAVDSQRVTMPVAVDPATERLIAGLIGAPLAPQVTPGALPTLAQPHSPPRPVQRLVMAPDSAEMSKAERAKQKFGPKIRQAIADLLNPRHWWH